MTKEEILTNTIRGINPKWDYGKTDNEVFRQLWSFFDPSPARNYVLMAMEEYARQETISFAEWGRNNGWDLYGDDEPHAWLHFEKQKKITSSELYSLYLNEKEK